MQVYQVTGTQERCGRHSRVVLRSHHFLTAILVTAVITAPRGAEPDLTATALPREAGAARGQRETHWEEPAEATPTGANALAPQACALQQQPWEEETHRSEAVPSHAVGRAKNAHRNRHCGWDRVCLNPKGVSLASGCHEESQRL